MNTARAGVRPIDLARLAGISTQQVRNYVDEGVLPPAGRTPSGYRELDQRHRSALLAYRAMLRGYGTATARGVMLAIHAGDVPAALALVDAGHAALHEQRLAVQATGEALEAFAAEPAPADPPLPRAGLRIGETAGYLRIRPSALRVWESVGLLAPRRERGTGYRRYDAADVRDAVMVKTLRDGRYPLPRIRAVIDGLRETGSTAALRTAIEERRTELTQRATAMLEAAGQLHEYLRSSDGLPAPQRGAGQRTASGS